MEIRVCKDKVALGKSAAEYTASLLNQIMQCENIVSCVPYAVKADAIENTLKNDVTNTVPATIMKTHKSFVLYADSESFAQVVSKDILWK